MKSRTLIIDRLVGCVGRLVDWSIGRLVDWSIGRLVDWSIGVWLCWSAVKFVVDTPAQLHSFRLQ